ncbi:MAG: desulfoferrodoxin [Clostridiales bacterium]|nr:desulfoferrodoxin [Clostridiales bacterium]
MAVERQKFYICKHCGNIISYIENSGVPVICCGEEMAELKAGVSDGAYEKHVPDVKVEGNKVSVQVGSTLHPMVPEHYISWIYIQTSQGGQRKILDKTGEPTAVFMLTDDDKLEIVYEYCNLHGLWKAEV